jgi:hypothetical protein
VTIAAGSVIAIVLAVLAVVALVVGLIAWRHCPGCAKADGRGLGRHLNDAEEPSYETGEFATYVNPNITFQDNSDNLTDEDLN